MISFKRELSTCFYFLVNRFSGLFGQLKQTISTRPCLLCMAGTSNRNSMCNDCQYDLPANSTPCYQCALPLASTSTQKKLHAKERLCGECISSSPPFQKTIAPFVYAYPINSCIHQFKFNGRLYFAKSLSRFLANAIRQEYASSSLPEALIPIPLHRKRKRQRGFNQSEVIARYLGRSLGIKVNTSCIKKIKETEAQSNLSKLQRKRNLRRAFRLKKAAHYRHIALIDDVMTTRATTEVIAKLFIDAGVEKVDVWCLARTPKPSMQAISGSIQDDASEDS